MDVYKPLRGWSEPASIPQIVAHIQKWLEEHPYIDPATVAELVKEALENNPDVINGDTIPIDESGTPTIKGYIDSNVDILTLAINAKADADNVYTKPEINYQMGQKANADSVYTKAESNALLNEKADKTSTYTKTETDTLLADKADKATTYTKTETDNLLADKADKATTYTKTETNNLLNNKADISSTYTKSETDALLANKADSSNVYAKTQTYSKSEVDDLFAGEYITELSDVFSSTILPADTVVRLRKCGRTVNLYLGISASALPSGTSVNVGRLNSKYFCGYNAISPFYSRSNPYLQVGSGWIDASGDLTIYKPSDVAGGYISITYNANR